jgi:hypothetical protein
VALLSLGTMVDPSVQAQNDPPGFVARGFFFACLLGIALGKVLSAIEKGAGNITQPPYFLYW